LKKVCGYYFENNIKQFVYLHEVKFGFFYVSISGSPSKIIEWFVVKKAVIPFCKNKFHGFEVEE
jgi:hypothetical protein